MTQEEKAKAYDEALERAKYYHDRDNVLFLKNIFPELKESEDERIRKRIIQALHGDVLEMSEIKEATDWLEKQGEKLPVGFYYVNSEGKKFYSDTFKYGDVILHVEKQGEQKPTNNVEPKFKVGDYIERKDGLGCHAKIIFVGENVYGCEKLIYSEDSSPFFEFMFKNQDKFQISSDFKQNPADKDEPKFKVGDWVIVSTTKGDKVVQIASVEYFKDGHPSYITTEGRWFGNGTKARLLTDKDVETIIIPESKAIKSQSEEDEY